MAVHSAVLIFYAEWLVFHNAPVLMLLALLLSLCMTDMVLVSLLWRTFQ